MICFSGSVNSLSYIIYDFLSGSVNSLRMNLILQH